MEHETTFIFEGDKVYAMRGTTVIASGSDIDEVEQKIAATPPHEPQQGDPGTDQFSPDNEVEMPEPPADVQGQLGLDNNCPQCHHPSEPQDRFCSACGSDLHGQEQDPGLTPGSGTDLGFIPHGNEDADGLRGASMKVVTPNGLEGTVLGRVKGTWGDEVTVRFANGRIVSLPVTDHLEFTASTPEKVDLVDDLNARLASVPDGTLDSLIARNQELTQIIATARGGEVTSELDSIIAQARAEIEEINQAVAHLEDENTQAYVPPAPFKMQAVEQESLGGASGNWLDNTVNEMIAEAENTDYEKLMDEGPEAFVAELPVATLAHAAAVRSMAESFINSHTAAADPSIREQYEGVWLSRVEQVRKDELAKVKDEVRKEASSELDDPSTPDDAMFL